MRYSVSLAVLAVCLGGLRSQAEAHDFRAGVAAIDISPETLPAIINGGFLRRDADQVRDPLFARAFVLDDGQTRIALCVVDTCMMPRELIDEAKALASDRVGIPTDRMMVSATHTHTAPAAMGCLGCPVDPVYAASLPSKIAEAIITAANRLEPAILGAAVVDDFDHTFCRRWIYRSDRMLTDPFGHRTVRANMHPGHQNPDAIGPSGPVDPALSVLAIQTADGKPLGVLANYSMHYYGTDAISSDYFGRFSTTLAEELGGGEGLVVSMSQGTSGDLMWMDYGAPTPNRDVLAYADAVAEVALGALKNLSYRDDVTLAMAEAPLTLGRRLPDDDRQDWARSVRSAMEGEEPRAIPEVYALEQFHLLDVPERELKLQAIRIGDVAITAIPNEVYGITGLKLKAASPLPITMNIELANGADGYIPPPEQHALGGYTTWPARTAGLEVEAEPKIVATLVELLETVSGSSRRPVRPQGGSYAQSVVEAGPIATFRLDELDGSRPANLMGGAPAHVEPGVALALPGPEGSAFVGANEEPNRAIHCAGGRLIADQIDLEGSYSLAFWFWNGLPTDARAVTGYLASIGPDANPDAPGDHLGIGGTHADLQAGRLFVFNGNSANDVRVGRTELPRREWCHVVLVRDGARVRVFLNGNPEPEIDAELPVTRPIADNLLVFGGRTDRFAGLEGKLDEVAVFDRALTAEDVASLFEAATSNDHD
ncbi:LamG-like jellyroll fold domain-containing protein [Tautonia marina]|uniref:LamG-like jellyroll fold domain-containing protein n=1 Tax=Tautonia marina TaxID=2653855 RepID=UPI0012604BF8|nr:LamG-like jellyroll fold domain-containing protein [Tautonia marina]